MSLFLDEKTFQLSPYQNLAWYLVIDVSLKVELDLIVDDKISETSFVVEYLVKAVLGSWEISLVESVSFIDMLLVVIEEGVEVLVVFPGKKNYCF